MQSVELLLNAEMDAHIRSQWESLAEAGFHALRPHHRPHVTVGVAQEIPPQIDRAITPLFWTLPFPLRLGGLVLFGEKRIVIARAVTMSRELLNCHQRLFTVMRECPGQPLHMEPGKWTPHVTLAKRIPAAEVGRAVEILATREDFTGAVVAARRWDGQRKIETIFASAADLAGHLTQGNSAADS
ncbi:hypothetical protein GCM10011410_23520 [Hoyosella rhizosphaerae]|uniref:2'-5' RNA ligase family protein n=2 Tax=Hoyosella rhizosphaerae TaxID=1755582 RepID=A0A916UEF1_9ACTN|nr:hypothetical protein GCM10011410_23520 [Hoyosella rhizosphaerae]